MPSLEGARCDGAVCVCRQGAVRGGVADVPDVRTPHAEDPMTQLRGFDLMVADADHPLHRHVRAHLEAQDREVLFSPSLVDPKTRHQLGKYLQDDIPRARRGTLYWLGMGFRRSTAEGNCIAFANRNVLGTSAVLCFARNQGFKRVVLRSSFDVVRYPSLQPDPSIAATVVRAAEEIAMAYSTKYFVTSVVRLGFLYGDDMTTGRHDESETVAWMYAKVPVPFSEEAHLPMIGLDDAAAALVTAGEGVSHCAASFPNARMLFEALHGGGCRHRNPQPSDYLGITDIDAIPTEQAETAVSIADAILADVAS